jgi:hypothetical protein
MACQTIYPLFLFIITTHTTIDGRAIQQDTVDLLVNDPTHDNEEMFSTLVNYRHRFEHSNNVKALRWMFQQYNDPPEVFCKICHILVPVVNSLSSFSYFCI